MIMLEALSKVDNISLEELDLTVVLSCLVVFINIFLFRV
jgi:hypothetical protein